MKTNSKTRSMYKMSCPKDLRGDTVFCNHLLKKYTGTSDTSMTRRMSSFCNFNS